MNKLKNPKLGHNKKTFLEKPVEHIDITSFDSRKIIDSMDKCLSLQEIQLEHQKFLTRCY